MTLHLIKQHFLAHRMWSELASLDVSGSKEVTKCFTILPNLNGTIHEEPYPLGEASELTPRTATETSYRKALPMMDKTDWCIA